MFGKYNTPTEAYAAACKEVALDVGTNFVDIYSTMSGQKVCSSCYSLGTEKLKFRLT